MSEALIADESKISVDTAAEKPRKKRVVVVGMGFGGLRAATSLANTDVEVLALDRRNFHLFQPLLYQVATSMLEQESIAYNTRSILREYPNVNFQMSDVNGFDLENKV